MKTHKYVQCRSCGAYGLEEHWNPKNMVTPVGFYGSIKYYCNSCMEKEHAVKVEKEEKIRDADILVKSGRGKECSVCRVAKPREEFEDWCESYEYGFCRECWKKNNFLESADFT